MHILIPDGVLEGTNKEFVTPHAIKLGFFLLVECVNKYTLEPLRKFKKELTDYPVGSSDQKMSKLGIKK